METLKSEGYYLVVENFKKGTFNREGYLDLNLNFLETAGYV